MYLCGNCLHTSGIILGRKEIDKGAYSETIPWEIIDKKKLKAAPVILWKSVRPELTFTEAGARQGVRDSPGFCCPRIKRLTGPAAVLVTTPTGCSRLPASEG